MDAYLGYNQVKMDYVEAHKTTFMSNNDNHYYYVMPIRLNNNDATCQWLKDVMAAHQGKL